MTFSGHDDSTINIVLRLLLLSVNLYSTLLFSSPALCLSLSLSVSAFMGLFMK